MQTIRIDPRDFIGGPYQTCPKCGQPEFGVLGIYEKSITRRCRIRACWHTETFQLPKIRKKVIYLDQFIFSNITKMLSPNAPGHVRAKAEPVWREFFEALGLLCRMQLVVCPYSTEHHDESLISTFYEELKRTYQHFSTGISFTRPVEIQHEQIMVAFSAHLKSQSPVFNFDPQHVTSGGLHGWNDRMFITVDGEIRGERQAIRQNRINVHSGLAAAFREWQKGGETFAQAFQREKAAFAKEVMRAYVEDHRKRMLVFAGDLPATLENFLGSMSGSIMQLLEFAAERSGLSSDQTAEAIISFIESGGINETPSNVISASIWASLALQAAAGQKKAPDEGMATDISIVSTLLPYCDAMFVDRRCWSLVSKIPMSHKPPYNGRLFSMANKDEFFEYLGGICASATREHVALLNEVYGPSSLEPPTSIYGVGARRKQPE